MPCEYFLLIRRQRRPCLLAIDDGLSLAGQHAGRVANIGHVMGEADLKNLAAASGLVLFIIRSSRADVRQSIQQQLQSTPGRTR